MGRSAKISPASGCCRLTAEPEVAPFLVREGLATTRPGGADEAPKSTNRAPERLPRPLELLPKARSMMAAALKSGRSQWQNT